MRVWVCEHDGGAMTPHAFLSSLLHSVLGTMAESVCYGAGERADHLSKRELPAQLCTQIYGLFPLGRKVRLEQTAKTQLLTTVCVCVRPVFFFLCKLFFFEWIFSYSNTRQLEYPWRWNDQRMCTCVSERERKRWFHGCWSHMTAAYPVDQVLRSAMIYT